MLIKPSCVHTQREHLRLRQRGSAFRLDLETKSIKPQPSCRPEVFEEETCLVEIQQSPYFHHIINEPFFSFMMHEELWRQCHRGPTITKPIWKEIIAYPPTDCAISAEVPTCTFPFSSGQAGFNFVQTATDRVNGVPTTEFRSFHSLVAAFRILLVKYFHFHFTMS